VIGLAAQAAASPDQQQLNAISLDLDAMRQNVDRIAITQEQIRRNANAGRQLLLAPRASPRKNLPWSAPTSTERSHRIGGNACLRQ
jgi:hypothetical protein